MLSCLVDYISTKIMNFGESHEDCSKNEQENGAASLEPDRPHKKARFPWQIKGKHHLKNQANEQTTASNVTLEPIENQTITSDAGISSIMEVPFGKIPDLASKKAKPDIDILDSTISRSFEPTGLLPSMPLETVISLAETLLLNSKIENNETESTIASNNIEEQPGPSKAHITAREARRLRKEEDKCIHRWQATQTVKGCFDNTINRVLESWMNSPGPAQDRFLAIDMARIMNDDVESNDDNVENEGILMAINAHGLQHMGVPTIAPNGPLAAALSSDGPPCADSDSSICSEDYEVSTERADSPWIPVRQRLYGPSSEEPVNYEPWSPVHENKNLNNSEPGEFAAPEDYEYEFMNTAVIQAMKSKGLMAAGMDFG